MIRFHVVVHAPAPIETGAERVKTFQWPVVPVKGQAIFLGPEEVDGVCVRVTDVKHWFGFNDIDVHCVISGHTDPVAAFHSLTKEEGWAI